MIATPPILFVGVGSPHGDDQIGWHVADGISASIPLNGGVTVRKSLVPLDLVDWLPGIDRLHVCDACRADGPVGAIHRLESFGPGTACAKLSAECDRIRCGGSHDFGLTEVLRLAAQLGRLPRRIVVHAIAGRSFGVADGLSMELANRLPEIVGTIREELDHARGVARAVAAESG